MFLLFFWETIFSFVCLAWLLLWPFCATIWGADTVVRQSLYFLIFCITSDSVRNGLNKISSTVGYLFGGVIEIAILATLFLQPITILPTFVISVYSFFLKYIAEFFFIFIEAKQILYYIRKSGKLFNEWIYDNEEKDYLFKWFVLFVSAIALVLGTLILKNGLVVTAHTTFTHLSILLIVISIFSFIATICNEEGIISDCAFVYFVSTFFIYASIITSLPREDWSVAPIGDSEKPLLYQILEIPEKTTVYANGIMHWVKRNYGFWFWFLFVIRLVLCLDWIYTESDDDDINESDLIMKVRWYIFNITEVVDITTVAKVLAVSIYTQMIIINSPLASSFTLYYLSFGALSKLIQCFGLSIGYVGSMFASSS